MIQRPEGDDPRHPMSDTDIVCGLRSADTERRVKALEALCGINGGLLIISGVKEQRITPTPNLKAQWVFPVILHIAQQLGASLGLRLGWVPDPQQQAATPGIVIAQPSAIPNQHQ